MSFENTAQRGRGEGGGEGGTPHNGLCGEALSERDVFFRLQVYERVEILLVEVYKRVGKSVIWVCERAQNMITHEFYGFIKSRKRSIFVIDCIYSSYKGCKVLNKVYESGTICR